MIVGVGFGGSFSFDSDYDKCRPFIYVSDLMICVSLGFGFTRRVRFSIYVEVLIRRGCFCLSFFIFTTDNVVTSL